MIAALFVLENGPYFGLENVDPWDVDRDAKQYRGPHAIVAHPPCERWGRYWSGGPSAKVRRKLGDDDGCFASALFSVRTFGGVLEHPADSHAFKQFGLGKPPRSGDWWKSDDGKGLICHVEQGHYGHPARKATWLYFCGYGVANLIWGPAPAGVRLDEGFHTAGERRNARAAGRRDVEQLSARQRACTPIAFRDALISIAENAWK